MELVSDRSPPEANIQDRFLNTLVRELKTHLSEPNFTVDQLGSELAMMNKERSNPCLRVLFY